MGDQIKTISPSTNKVIFETQGISLRDSQNVVKASTQAFSSWKNVPFSQRKEVVVKALQLLQKQKNLLAEELTLQMGRPIAFGTKEIETMQKRADYLLAIAEQSLPGQPEAGFRRWIEKEPLGPTLIVFVWNFPYLIIVNSLLPALLAGNTLVLKPSPQTPLVGNRIAEIFSQAGLPKDVLQVIHSGNQETLKSIVQFPDIKLISFVGSTEGGRMLRENTASRFVPVNLELGGNDPAYIRPDADLKYVAEQVVDGAVFNSGQSCCAIERVYVHEDVHEDFLKGVQKELAQYKLGDPSDKSVNVGPVISRAAQASVNAQIQDALTKGALNVTPENPSFANPPADGNYVVPTILTDVNHDMVVMQEETFGPVIPIMKVESDDEAVKWMNTSDHGLTASVWTKDLVAGEKLLKQLEAGTVFINRCDYPNPDLAWTGWKNSGMGHTLGPRAFDPFYKLKSYHIRENQG
ncbi:hypothetical protein PENSTE_c005G00048 [Penicillium steckii]|uniref:aldehyde dehydrogenase (NAD(+)) n=1 Tax=Penicillium steckii TaxID=303698 RepID=A0A1V6TLI3_9EURO|nr:hypothetical protein PENSTE_c005G00048 [Penicillium steckii]